MIDPTKLYLTLRRKPVHWGPYKLDDDGWYRLTPQYQSNEKWKRLEAYLDSLIAKTPTTPIIFEPEKKRKEANAKRPKIKKQPIINDEHNLPVKIVGHGWLGKGPLPVLDASNSRFLQFLMKVPLQKKKKLNAKRPKPKKRAK